MPEALPTLDDLRRQIDEIDVALQELIVRRAEVVTQVGELKNRISAGARAVHMRPAREAIILRRLVARHRGPLSKATLVRMWCELMSASLRLEGSFAVAVYMPSPAVGGYWDLARDYFGSLTHLIPRESARQALGAVFDGEASVAVLPMPQSTDTDHWWRLLLSRDAKAPRIVARLPFGARGSERGAPVEALVVGPILPEASGLDRSLIAVETAAELSRSALAAAFKAEDLDPTFRVFGVGPAETGGYLHLIEIPGFLSADDNRMARLARRLGPALQQVWTLGCYAEALTDAELGIASKAKGAR
jgi:chorismate mutase